MTRQTGRKYSQPHISNNLYSKCINNNYNSVTRQPTQFLKMDKWFELTLHKQYINDIEMWSIAIVIQDMQVKSTMRYYYTKAS